LGESHIPDLLASPRRLGSRIIELEGCFYFRSRAWGASKKRRSICIRKGEIMLIAYIISELAKLRFHFLPLASPLVHSSAYRESHRSRVAGSEFPGASCRARRGGAACPHGDANSSAADPFSCPVTRGRSRVRNSASNSPSPQLRRAHGPLSSHGLFAPDLVRQCSHALPVDHHPQCPHCSTSDTYNTALVGINSPLCTAEPPPPLTPRPT
jgi:hypothetical protein